MVLKWASLGPGYRYRVYWNSPVGRLVHPVDEASDVTTRGAVVDVNPAWKKGFLTVTAIGPGEIESPPSEPVPFETTPVNKTDAVEPLPLTADARLKTRDDRARGNLHPSSPVPCPASCVRRFPVLRPILAGRRGSGFVFLKPHHCLACPGAPSRPVAGGRIGTSASRRSGGTGRWCSAGPPHRRPADPSMVS
jgi:hypothetical protein